jgi:hypothetical protein
MGWTEASEFESRYGQESSPLHVKTGSEAYPASYPMRIGALFLRGIKRPGRDADHSSPSSAEVKKTWIYISTPPYVFME